MLVKSALQWLSPAGPRGKLSIFIFHRVLAQPDPLFPDEIDAVRFDQMMGWIAGWFNVLPLDDAVERLRSGSLPAGAACITFDDGYADNYDIALPILQRHGLTATFFIATGFLDGGRMWNDTIIEAVRRTKLPWFEADIPGMAATSIASVTEKRNVLGRLIPAIKHLPPAGRVAAVERIAAAAQADLPDDLMLTTTQLRGLRRAGMLIGAHTLSHPILATLDEAEADREIAGSKTSLERLLDEPVRLFAYPNGRPGRDYSARDVAIVKRLGFEAAVSTCWGGNTRQADPFQLLRFTPWDRTKNRFALRMLANLRQTAHELPAGQDT